MNVSSTNLETLCTRVSSTESRLRATPSSQIIDALVDTAASLIDRGGPFFNEAMTKLPKSSGLSQPMVAWALETTMRTVTVEALQRVVSDIDQTPSTLPPPNLVATVLAGNLFTAPMRAVFIALLARCPVVVKASTKEDHFVRLLHRALAERDCDIAESVGVVTFAGGDVSLENLLFRYAPVVTAFGSDETLAAIEDRLPSDKTFLRHGHGVGVAYIPATALEQSERWIRSVALDVAAYDQRGCLSPQAIWVQEGGAITPRAFAAILAREGLTAISQELPRGPLPAEIAASQMQWRGVARATAELFEASDHAVSYECETPFRASPGYRNVAVRSASSWDDFLSQLAPLVPHLKCVGVAAQDLPPLDDLRQRNINARLCRTGAMQTPPFVLETEGRKPWAGLR